MTPTQRAAAIIDTLSIDHRTLATEAGRRIARDLLTQCIEVAVREEREACAALATVKAREYERADWYINAATAAGSIAAEIRERGERA